MTPTRQVTYVPSPGRGMPGYFHSPPAAPRDSGHAPLLVMVHGISRNAAEHAVRAAAAPGWQAHSIIAPVFDADSFGHYQSLRAGPDQTPADQALLDLLDCIGHTGDGADRIELFGFSGGAQFAHRFALRHPERIRFLSLAAAGWYTLPDEATPYPRGLGGAGCVERLGDFLALPIQVLVGARDRARDSTLRQSEALDRTQGRTRLDRAKTWRKAVQRAAEAHGVSPRLSFDIVPGGSHDFGQCVTEGGMLDLVWHRRCEALTERGRERC